VDDERMCRRTALGGEDFSNGDFVLRVGAEAVDRLGRNADEASSLENVDGQTDFGAEVHASLMPHLPELRQDPTGVCVARLKSITGGHGFQTVQDARDF
jgi:hypothetical protein